MLFSIFYSVSSLFFALYSFTIIMPPIHCERPAIKQSVLDLQAVGLSSKPVPTSATGIQVKLFNKLIWTYINKVPTSAIALVETRDNANRFLKSLKLDLYFDNLHIECYYFYQQCEDHFNIISLLGSKPVLFTTGFLNDQIFNWW